MSFPVVEIGFILSQRHCRFLFISVVAGLLILLQRQVTTDNDLMETRLNRKDITTEQARINGHNYYPVKSSVIYLRFK